ncbi:hypothetical protein [Flavobacterium sp. N2270]|uniref:hypothetical protein n=1 Tax=Flavobacterium sp. N2270 TaxID=2986831 RepID=UPI0022255005|nr:hypothetical protein [Flavobacterium sp. N2270]
MKVVRENDRFCNIQMLNHFGEITEKIKIEADEVISVEFYGEIIQLNNVIVEFSIAYNKLKKKYRLESESLLDEIVYRLDVDNSDVVKSNIKALLGIAYKKIKSLKYRD